MFPASIKLWEPNSQIQQYFQENSDRLRSILLQGRDPRPGNATFIFLTEGPKSPPQWPTDEDEVQIVHRETATLIPAFDDSVSKVINAVLRAEGRTEKFGHWAMPGNISPDFIVAVPNSHNFSTSFLPGEAKVNILPSSTLQFHGLLASHPRDRTRGAKP